MVADSDWTIRGTYGKCSEKSVLNCPENPVSNTLPEIIQLISALFEINVLHGHLHPWQGSWNKTIFKVPSIPSHTTIKQGVCWGEELRKY